MDFDALDRQGYLLFREAVLQDCVERLRIAFDAGIVPSDQWPVPRASDWHHSLLDLDPDVQHLCRLPVLIDGVRHILKQPFFLAQVEGREPLAGNAPQLLHRDGAGMTRQYVAAIAWLDPYDAENGATQIIPGTHRENHDDSAMAEVLAGDVGDILLFDPDVLHGATTNRTGARRRSLLLSYAAVTLRAQHKQTEALRNIRMDTSEIFV
jgi:hypothetical protein